MVSAHKMYHLFPFHLVERDSDIILYGYGSMGRQYVEQLSKSGYCNVKYIVDQRREELADPHYEIKSPEELLREDHPTIVITTDRYVDEIRSHLMKMGIPPENIVAQNIELDAYSTEYFSLSEENQKYLNDLKTLLSVMDINPDKEFVRIGKDHDGGYLMVDDFIAGGGIAYSFGINNDVSWDRDMTIRGYDVFMYDHTIEGLPEEHEKYHWVKKGVASAPDEKDDRLQPLEQLIRDNGHDHEKHMILKMDVEGAEWGCLEMTPPEVLAQFDQIVMEFHSVIQFRMNEKILKALEKLQKTHQCVHVHINNYGGYMMMDGVPYGDSVEVTYVSRDRYSFAPCAHSLPHKLDQPNHPLMQEIVLGDHYCG